MRIGCELKAIKNRANIGAELPVLGIDLVPSSVRETPSLFNGGVGFGERFEGVVMLTIGNAACVTESFFGIRMALDDTPSSNGGSQNECNDSSGFSLLSGFLVCICLIISSFVCPLCGL